jgi:hypothetical protein
MESQIETSPSGKTVTCLFDDDGNLTKEMHIYGIIDIGITLDFEDGKKTSETYIFKNRMILRKKYEKERLKYEDMPAADMSREDSWADIIKAANKERRQQAKEIKDHIPDPQSGKINNDLCLDHIAKTTSCNADSWLQNKKSTLGEFNRTKSKSILKKLVDLGCTNLVACNVESDSEGNINAGELVAELPIDKELRKSLFKYAHRLASNFGFYGDSDDGQKYLFLKFD